MALAKSFTVSLLGLAGTVIEIEADISSNLPNFVLVGLPDASLSESTSRVKAAIVNSGLKLPSRRITVNLSPASVPKHGSSFDLAIAITVLAASGEVRAESVVRHIHLGELGLDGSIRPVRGILPAVLAARNAGFGSVIVPALNLAEARLVADIEVVGAHHLSQVAAFHGASVKVLQQVAPQFSSPMQSSASSQYQPDISDVYGQDVAVKALSLAAAGGHHIAMKGAPGAGKTMLAERLPGLLPDLDLEQSLETTALISVSGRSMTADWDGKLITRPPFEAPHHSASVASLVGGGSGYPKPGSISMANHGVLFLDEAPEFQQPALEALRQPLESGEVIIHRSAGMAKFPSRFQLILASNPCPCGNLLSRNKSCTCTAAGRSRYNNKLSGPLLDRIDIQLEIAAANPAQIALAKKMLTSERVTSAQIRDKVFLARMLAAERLSGTPWKINSQIAGPYLRRKLKPHSSITGKIDKALDLGRISMRGYDRCLRLAWTSADFDGRSSVSKEDLDFALFLRGGSTAGESF